MVVAEETDRRAECRLAVRRGFLSLTAIAQECGKLASVSEHAGMVGAERSGELRHGRPQFGCRLVEPAEVGEHRAQPGAAQERAEGRFPERRTQPGYGGTQFRLGLREPSQSPKYQRSVQARHQRVDAAGAAIGLVSGYDFIDFRRCLR